MSHRKTLCSTSPSEIQKIQNASNIFGGYSEKVADGDQYRDIEELGKADE